MHGPLNVKMAKLIVAFSDLANAPKSVQLPFKIDRTQLVYVVLIYLSE